MSTQIQYAMPRPNLILGIAASMLFCVAAAFTQLLAAAIVFVVAMPWGNFAVAPAFRAILFVGIFLIPFTGLSLYILRNLFMQKRWAVSAAIGLAAFNLGAITFAFVRYELAIDIAWPAAISLLTSGALIVVGISIFVSRAAAPNVEPTPEQRKLLWFFEDNVLYAPAFGMVAFVYIFVMPNLIEIFRDFRTDLPAITNMALAFSFHPPTLWIPIATVLTALAAMPGFLIRYGRPAPVKRRLAIPIGNAFFLYLGLMVLLLVATLAPLVKLIQSVTGGE
jgi:hypothetical protein